LIPADGTERGASALLDTLHTVETPEGVRLELRTAGPVPRALAYAIDASIRWGVYLVVLMVLTTTLSSVAGPLMLLLIFVGEWFYPVLFEMFWSGQTLGKRVVGLRVVNDDGTPVTWASSMLRNLLLSADMVPGTYLAGLVSSLVSTGHRRLGDLAAGTLVIHASGVLNASGALPTAAPVEPPFRLEVGEQRALIALAERAALLSDARVDELAEVAEPLHADGVAARDRVLGAATWLLGRGDEAMR